MSRHTQWGKQKLRSRNCSETILVILFKFCLATFVINLHQVIHLACRRWRHLLIFLAKCTTYKHNTNSTIPTVHCQDQYFSTSLLIVR